MVRRGLKPQFRRLVGRWGGGRIQKKKGLRRKTDWQTGVIKPALQQKEKKPRELALGRSWDGTRAQASSGRVRQAAGAPAAGPGPEIEKR